MLAALAHRDRTGEGQYIDMALLDVQVAAREHEHQLPASGSRQCAGGNAHPNIVPYQTFQTRDGWIIVAVGNDGQFRKFVEAGGLSWRTTSVSRRIRRARHRDTLVPILAEMVKARAKPTGSVRSKPLACRAARSTISTRCSTTSSGGRARDAGVAAAPVRRGREARAQSDPDERDAAKARTAAAALAQTDDVLRDMLGYDDDAKIAALRAKQAI